MHVAQLQPENGEMWFMAGEGGELAELWIRAKRYGGKGCLNAVENVVQVVAPRFLGQKISSLGSLADLDRELLLMELDLAVKRGKIAADAPAEQKVQIMQRKANLGMNAVLSLSLALGRLVAVHAVVARTLPSGRVVRRRCGAQSNLTPRPT